jgi:hypothetical protein
MKIPHDPRHLGDPSGGSKTISEPVVCSAQTMQLSYVKISTISKWTESSFHLSLITKEYHRVRPTRFLKLCYVWHKLYTYLALTLTLSWNGPNEIPHDPGHLGVPLGASKTIFELMVHLVKSLDLSCTNTNTISKRTETRFQTTLVT